MKTCKNCVFWTAFSADNWADIPTWLGKCSKDKFIESSGLYLENASHDILIYSDLEGYSAEFSVAENFGCLHFQRRVEAEGKEMR